MTRVLTLVVVKATLFWSLLFATLASAQNISCSLSGTVQDPTGAGLPDVEAILTNSDTGFSWRTTTNVEGLFSFASLTPGTLSLEIAAPGYRHYAENGIDVGPGEQRLLGVIRLKLGEISESVTVMAEPSHVKLASGERSGIITEADLSTLATRAGDVMDAVTLLPGVVDTSDGREVASSQSMVSIYISGGRSNQKNMTVDGVALHLNRILRNFGAASWARGFPRQYPRFQQVETRPAVHLSFNHFQAIDVPFQRPIVPGRRNR